MWNAEHAPAIALCSRCSVMLFAQQAIQALRHAVDVTLLAQP